MDAPTLVRRLLQEFNLTDDATGVAIPLPLRCTTGKKGNRARETVETVERKKVDDQREWQLSQCRMRAKKPTT